MVDIMLLLMAIASAISLLVVSPRDLQRKVLLALREREEMELSPASAAAKSEKPPQSQGIVVQVRTRWPMSYGAESLTKELFIPRRNCEPH
jgi:hypothetical protein